MDFVLVRVWCDDCEIEDFGCGGNEKAEVVGGLDVFVRLPFGGRRRRIIKEDIVVVHVESVINE